MNFNFAKKFRIILGISIGCFCISSCSAFFGNDTLTILNTNVETDDDGNVTVTINFAEDGKSPLIFTIPKAIDGVDGVGIANVTSKLSDDKTMLTIIITYTDEGKEPTILTVPIYNGKDGKEITHVIQDYDDFGNTTIVFEYNDGSKSETVTINKGNDGVGIQEIQTETLTDGRIQIVVCYTDGSMSEPFYISNGIGISSVEVDNEANEEYYILNVYYTDGTITQISLEKPKTTQWLSGTAEPNDAIGNIGDFYVLITTGSVFKKDINGWEYLFSIKGTGTDVYCVVTFNVNGGKWVNGNLTDPNASVADKNFRVKYGATIDLSSNELQCYNNNMEFGGWWTDSTISVNSGHFTNMSCVFNDIILYAHWI